MFDFINNLVNLKLYQKFIILFLVVLLAYGLTLGMYIWQDDNAIMFKLQNLEEGGGNLGHGIYDRNTPYRGVIVPLVPLYYFFGLEPVGYFVVGLIVYFLASVTVYYLAKELSSKEDLAFGAALIFASGFVGGETLWRIYNSIHTILNIIFICLSLIFYSQSVKQTSLIKYLISLFFFWVAMETGYVRAHGVIFLILGLEVIFNFRFRTFVKSLLRIVPFMGLYYHYYVRTNANAGPVHLTFNKIFLEGKVEILYSPFITLKNIIIPDIFNTPDSLFIVVLFSLLIWKRSRILWYAVIFMMQSYIVPLIHFQGQTFASVHRYLTLSLVGLSFFYSELLGSFFKQKKFFFAAILIIAGLHLYLIDKEQIRIVKHVGIPTRNFYRQLKEQLPQVPKNAAIYFDVAGDQESTNQFYNFFGVGSMPETTAIAIYYNIDRYDLTLPATYNELLSLLKNGKTLPEKIFTFYFDAKTGLTNTTPLTRQALFGKKDDVSLDRLDSINLSYTTPVELKFSALTELKDIVLHKENGNMDFNKYLAYLLSRNDYYKQVTATASSQWKYQEIENSVDNNVDTSWMAHRGDWHYKRIQDMVFDLGYIGEIGAVRIRFRSRGKAATDYSYLCSPDKIGWTDLKHVYRSVVKDSEEVTDILPKSNCRYIKVIIKNTAGDDEPQISELEIVKFEFSDLDFTTADKILDNPFLFVATEDDKAVLIHYLTESKIPATVCKYTNKRINSDPVTDCQPIKLKLDTKDRYSLIIPPDGTILRKLEITTLPEINIKVTEPQLHFMTFKELNERKYIFDYSQN